MVLRLDGQQANIVDSFNPSRELHVMGLIAYNRRAHRYHLVWPTVDALAAFCTALDAETQLAVPTTDLATPRPGYALS